VTYYLIFVLGLGAGWWLAHLIVRGRLADLERLLALQRQAVVDAAVAKDAAEREARQWRRRHAQLTALVGDPFPDGA